MKDTPMKVLLIAHTPDPERVVAAGAKTCYSTRSMDRLMEQLDGESAAGFVEMLREVGHESPVEHAVFTFAVSGVSRSLLAQLTRHRIASYSVRSQRYVAENDFEYVVPPAVAAVPEALALYHEIMERDQAAYNRISGLLAEKKAEELVAGGANPQEARKTAKKAAQEDARFVLPNACATQLIFTMNARSLRGFFRQRCCQRAQWEIRGLADEMLRLVREVSPALFRDCGPGCVTGPCPEGKMSCGRMVEMRGRYRNG